MIQCNINIYKISDNKPHMCIRAAVISTTDGDNCVKIKGVNPVTCGTYKICLNNGGRSLEESLS